MKNIVPKTIKKLSLYTAFLSLIISSGSAFGMAALPVLETGTEVDVSTFEVSDYNIWVNVSEDGESDILMTIKGIQMPMPHYWQQMGLCRF
jgi:hypothetical protein